MKNVDLSKNLNRDNRKKLRNKEGNQRYLGKTVTYNSIKVWRAVPPNLNSVKQT